MTTLPHIVTDISLPLSPGAEEYGRMILEKMLCNYNVRLDVHQRSRRHRKWLHVTFLNPMDYTAFVLKYGHDIIHYCIVHDRYVSGVPF